MSVKRVTKGTVLFHPEQECTGFVIVHAGTIKVSLTAENGREIVLYRVRPGEVCLQTFGCLVKGSRYSAEGIAETDLEIEIVPIPSFQNRVANDEGFRRSLFDAVAARFFDLERLVEDVALSTIAERLARVLLRLSDGAGDVAATHDQLAIEIGSARAVVSRQLGEFQRLGLVTGERARIHILEPKKLRQIAHLSEDSAIV